jgi:PEP-CTERM motif
LRRNTRHMLKSAMGLLSVAGLAGSPAAAQTHLSIHVTSIFSGNILSITGLGDLGGGVGHGTYQLGNCSYNGVNRSYCVVDGAYVETAGSNNPGATGVFTWRMSWLGSGPNPISVKSNAPGSNVTTLHSVPAGSFFEVFLGNGLYANLDFGAPDTPNPLGGALNWQAFLTAGATCTGLPPGCSVSDAMLSTGANIQSPLSAFDMQLDYRTNVVPEPSTTALLGVGLLAMAVQGYRRRNRLQA